MVLINKFVPGSQLKIFTDYPLFKLDLIYIFDDVKNFVASPARIALAAI